MNRHITMLVIVWVVGMLCVTTAAVTCALRRAEAGVVTDWCLRKLISDDPYEFETAPTWWVVRAVDTLCIAKRWRALSTDDQSRFDRMLAELRRRTDRGPDDERNLIDEVLIRCAQ